MQKNNQWMCDQKSGENRLWFLIIRHGSLELALKEVFAIYLEQHRLYFILDVQVENCQSCLVDLYNAFVIGRNQHDIDLADCGTSCAILLNLFFDVRF